VEFLASASKCTVGSNERTLVISRFETGLNFYCTTPEQYSASKCTIGTVW